MSRDENQGFTLVELAIVLVIIGLLVGGVLQGQELLEQSRIRKQITQVNEFSRAVNTFKTKYNYLPGDMLTTHAAAFGFTNASIAASGPWVNIGNGNNLIEDFQKLQPPQNMWGEDYLAFIQLSEAGLVKGKYG